MDSKPWLARTLLPLSVAAVILGTGCYPTVPPVRVVQMLPVDQPRQRLFVVVHEGEVPARYVKRMAQEMASVLGRHLPSRSAILTGVEFDRRPLDDDIAAFRAEAVLVIKPIAVRPPIRRHGVGVATFALTLHDQPSDRTVWAAKAEPYRVPTWPEDVANDIVAALAASRMIPPEPEQAAAQRRANERPRLD
jgi:hypothetical protein